MTKTKNNSSRRTIVGMLTHARLPGCQPKRKRITLTE
nr:MAG TPA: hypothetical protein [Caudoviricetes sp.]